MQDFEIEDGSSDTDSNESDSGEATEPVSQETPSDSEGSDIDLYSAEALEDTPDSSEEEQDPDPDDAFWNLAWEAFQPTLEEKWLEYYGEQFPKESFPLAGKPPVSDLPAVQADQGGSGKEPEVEVPNATGEVLGGSGEPQGRGTTSPYIPPFKREVSFSQGRGPGQYRRSAWKLSDSQKSYQGNKVPYQRRRLPFKSRFQPSRACKAKGEEKRQRLYQRSKKPNGGPDVRPSARIPAWVLPVAKKENRGVPSVPPAEEGSGSPSPMEPASTLANLFYRGSDDL